MDSLEGEKTCHLNSNVVGAVDGVEIRVGSVVWNRCRENLAMAGPDRLPLIYGGNIVGAKLELNVERYRQRQYVNSAGASTEHRLAPPFIAIRRTLRGSPGDWIFDGCDVGDGGEYLAENHVITVCGRGEGLRFGWMDLKKELQSRSTLIGSPSLAADFVRRVVADLRSSKDGLGENREAKSTRRSIGGGRVDGARSSYSPTGTS